MEDRQNTLEKLKKEKENLKDMLAESEKEMECIKARASQDIEKIKGTINYFTEKTVKLTYSNFNEKSTQAQCDFDYNQAFLHMGKLDMALDKIRHEIIKITQINEKAALEIKNKKENLSKIAMLHTQNLDKLSKLQSIKHKIFSEISALQEKQILYEDNIIDSASLSVLKVLKII